MFSRPVSSKWKPVPTSSREATRPRIARRPALGSVILETIFSSVLLPAPLRPISPTISPRATSKLTSLRAWNKLRSSRGPREPWNGAASIAMSVSRRVRYRGACRGSRRYVLVTPSARIAISLMRASHDVGEGFFHSPEVVRSTDQQNEGDQGRHADHRARRCCHVEEGPAETLDDPDHGIEPIHGAPGLREEAARIGDRRREEPDLQQERHDEPYVSIVHVQGREPEGDSERRDEREQDEERQPQDAKRGWHAVVEDHDDQHDEGEEEVDDSREDGGQRHAKPGEVHLLEEVRAADETVGSLVEAIGEQRPRHKRREREDRVRDAVRGHPGQPAEEDTEDDHRQQGLQDRPGGTQQCLLVAHLHVAPDEEVEELPIRPQFAELQ